MKLFYLFCAVMVILLSAQCAENAKVAKNKSITVKLGERIMIENSDLSYIFDLKALPEITLSVSSNEWNTLLREFDQNKFNEKCVRADFAFHKDGKRHTLDNIGLRIRGNVFSRERPEGYAGDLHDPQSPDYHMAHFRLKFNEYKKGEKFFGLKGLNLKFFNGDPAYVREIYCYDLFRRFGVYTAQHVSYVRLKIRIKEDKADAYFGVYRMLEPIDEVFVKRRFENRDKGFLWKCLWPADLNEAGLSSRIGIETNGKNPAYDLKTRKADFQAGKTQLTDFVRELNQKEGKDFEEWAHKRIDIDLFLRALAVNVAVGMWDDYWVNKNNYYLYFDDHGKMHFIPYDYDNALGTFAGSDAGDQDPYEWGDIWGGNEDRPLVEKILAVPEFLDKYTLYLRELVDEGSDFFQFDHSTNRISRWHQLIKPYIDNDTGDMTSIEDIPADWGGCHYYRLLSGGDGSDNSYEVNYFKKRIKAIREAVN